jgi:hypothetical protein
MHRPHVAKVNGESVRFALGTGAFLVAVLVDTACRSGVGAATAPGPTPSSGMSAGVQIEATDAPNLDDFRDCSVDLLVPAAPAPSAHEPMVDEARPHYYRDTPAELRAIQDRNYPRLRELFLRDYQLTGRPALLYNLAIVAEELEDPGAAAALLRAYTERAPDLPHDRRADVERRLADLEAKTGWLAVRCEPGLRRITLDDQIDLTQVCPGRVRVRTRAGVHTLHVWGSGGEAAATATVPENGRVALWAHASR